MDEVPSTDRRNQRRSSPLWSAALETWAHQLLYHRRVYPKDTFGTATFLGLKTYCNRHPQVVSYIRDTIHLGVPALLDGTADQFSLVITRDVEQRNGQIDGATIATTEVLEEYIIRITNFSRILDGKTANQSNIADHELERSFRDLVLAIHGLDRNTSSPSPSMTFRLDVHLQEMGELSQKIHAALETGHWYSPSRDQKGSVLRPLYQAATPAGNLHFTQRRPVRPTRQGGN